MSFLRRNKWFHRNFNDKKFMFLIFLFSRDIYLRFTVAVFFTVNFWHISLWLSNITITYVLTATIRLCTSAKKVKRTIHFHTFSSIWFFGKSWNCKVKVMKKLIVSFIFTLQLFKIHYILSLKEITFLWNWRSI